MHRVALAVSLIAAPAAAAEQQQFDLICSSPTEAQRYRIDLSRGEWCFEQCQMVQKIANVTSGMITLANHAPGYRGDYTAYNQINRLTGEWTWYNHDPRYTSVMDIRGKCEAADFSGLPTAKF